MYREVPGFFNACKYIEILMKIDKIALFFTTVALL